MTKGRKNQRVPRDAPSEGRGVHARTRSGRNGRAPPRPEHPARATGGETKALAGWPFMRREVLFPLALAALVVASYFPAFFAALVWDDATFTEARPVREWSGLWRIWFSPSHLESEGHYWPITYTTFWLEHKLWGFAPAGYHAVNLALHFANTLLLLTLLRQLAVPGAFFAAALFAVHPAHVEAVVWVIARKDLLATLFFLSACHVWIRFVAPASGELGRARIKPWLLAFALYVAGLLSKTVAVTLPAALLIWHWWKRDRVTSRDVLRLLPFFAAGLAFAVADTAYYSSREILSFDYSLAERILLAAQALGFYLAKLVWPTDLIVIYPHWEVSVTNGLAWLCAAGIAAGSGALWFLRRRIGKGPLAAVLFFVVVLAPVLGLIDYGYMKFSFVADRYQYLASAGILALFAAWAALGMARLPTAPRRALPIVAVALVVILGTLTWRQAGLYRDAVTLFSHITERNPQARSGWHNLATALLAAQRHEEALDAARRAIATQPDITAVYAVAGSALIKLDRPEEAEEILREGLRRQPGERNTLLNLGEALRHQNRHVEALPNYQAAIEKDPNLVNAYIGLGSSLNALERHEEAREWLMRGLSMRPTAASASRIHTLLGESLAELGRHEEADHYLRHALRLVPEEPGALASLANMRLSQNRFEEALGPLTELLALEPDNPSVHLGVARALSGLAHHGEARTRLERALDLDPTGPLAADIHTLLGRTLRALGKPGEAENHFERALQADSRHAETLVELGNLRLARGRFGEALGLFRTLAEIHPDAASVHGGIGIALVGLGEEEKALAAFDRALSLDPSQERLRVERERVRRVIEGSQQQAQ